ncbi:MAG: dipeptide epimerase [Hyphomonadaceae bacterium]|jgi:L-alanine-DL-glutamate epimerase-like enolase superfamily enzyme|nr:dipeptide epimerase [Hyphomonadaceae bacterium]
MSARTTVTVTEQVWPLKAVFRIAHGARSEARVVTVELGDSNHRGRGECVPYARYGESPASVIAQIEAIRTDLEAGAGREAVQSLLPPGAARNAVDCALWELDARRAGVPVWQLAGLPGPAPVTTAYTIALDAPEVMADAARAAGAYPLLKVKIGGAGDLDRIAAIVAARPDARLIVDANEGLDADSLPHLLDQARDWRIEVIEQPFGASKDSRLSRIAAPVAICADESFHVAADLETVIAGYDAVNVKLDKTGGLTEAIRAVRAARDAGLKVMVGCMVGSSLGAAPAALLAGLADWVDLDGPLLLAADQPVPLVYHGAMLQPASPQTWG